MLELTTVDLERPQYDDCCSSPLLHNNSKHLNTKS